MTATQKALFKVISGTNSGSEISVHFNPVSLDYTITNTLEEKGQGSKKKQFVSQSSGKLSMALIFDTTHDGSDVRIATSQIAQFMQPNDEKAPPVVQFEWGAYSFKGMLESFKETIDFFAPTGVPLRSSINLTLSQQDVVFEPSVNSNFDGKDSLSPDTVDVPSNQSTPQSTTELATKGGNPAAGRALAALNNQESMRFPSGAIAMPEGIDLKGPVAFSSGSSSGGLSLGGSGLSGGLSVGAGDISASLGSTEAAFSGLKDTTASSVRLDPLRLLPTPGAATGDSSSVQVGGQILGAGSSGLKADVGLKVDLRARIQFGTG
ncbi:hypothetical protein [cf. Phormidesmis sp. LEGE 11477]|uniref:CIS tube protein n=1 Tax=cf. Phormidesmis sp. LEGE 11477 TaxID=1828680 RepID=UPI00187F1B9E|nr:hypothetical protein [cf. Phormidesmis sp. LEGE 11477]MBE9064940.1 hypothetical protein [cf. Phormidesmis sp. LEGE 11477]